MSVVAVALVAVVLLVWLAVASFTALRLQAGRRHRQRARAPEDVPDGFVADAREPEGLRAPFALLAVGEVVDLPHAYRGTWQGREAGIADVAVRLAPGQPPQQYTVVVLEVEQRFPWTRVRLEGVAAPEVAGRRVDLADLERRAEAAQGWILEGAEPTFVAEFVSDDLLAWLGGLHLPIQVELVPRHLLVAVEGRVPSDDLPALLGVATELSGHVPTPLWQAHLPPRPEDDV